MRAYNFMQAERDALSLFMQEGPCSPEDFKHGTDPDDNFDPDQLAQGAQVETEHSDDLEVAKAIAKAHLAELPDYYTRLAAMEAEGRAETGNATGNAAPRNVARKTSSSVYRVVYPGGTSCL